MSYLRNNIERMAGYSPGYQPKESGFIKLNTNENPYPPSRRVIEAVCKACGSDLRKYPPPLADAFREQAARMFDVRAENILCGFGSDDLLRMAVMAFCGEGEVVAFPYPSYSLFEVLARMQNARAAIVDFPEDFSLPKGLARKDARLVIVPNPNAPSGTLVPKADMEALARTVKGVLLIDEAYVDFSEWNCMELAARYRNVLVTRTLSKSYALAGLRFGYAVAQQELIEGMTKVKDSYNVSGPAIAGATAAIADQDWLGRNVERIKATRAALIRGLEQLGCFCWPSQSNFVLTRIPESHDAEQVYEELFRRKILVRYFKASRLDDCLRITVGTDHEIDALLVALGEILA